MRSPPSQPYSARTLYPPELKGGVLYDAAPLLFPRTRTPSKRPLVLTPPAAQPCIRLVPFAATAAQTSGCRWACEATPQVSWYEVPRIRLTRPRSPPLDVIPRQPPIFQPPRPRPRLGDLFIPSLRINPSSISRSLVFPTRTSPATNHCDLELSASPRASVSSAESLSTYLAQNYLAVPCRLRPLYRTRVIAHTSLSPTK